MGSLEKRQRRKKGKAKAKERRECKGENESLNRKGVKAEGREGES